MGGGIVQINLEFNLYFSRLGKGDCKTLCTHAWTDCRPDADRVRKIFCLVKEKKPLDIKIFNRVGKTMKSYNEF